ncbi:MAG: glutamate-1-semialdehyde 2,1-aminomutase [Peptococcaceae bacterium]|jgi:glutamate-1-semialdehyde 2,1-aminomutase|nr:glutamate-1-semialdehyde 2,1-aminomutase [Peptococcaceae bacterium]MDH7525799.1 glutamate-1-semialdehyde 2,1-aminomutase [Peptococcaceae bacterium]
MKTGSRRSKQCYEEACRVIPGGVNSPVRAFKAVGDYPLFIESGLGARVTDVDGNEYLDYVGSWGPLILGHRHPRVVEAIRECLERKGTSFGAPTELETEMARLICEALPSVELVRMVNSGTEATMSALRLARARTGRSKLLKFEGCYHGHADPLLVRAGSGALTFGVPSSPGVPKETAAETMTASYNDVEGVIELFRSRGEEIAAVIVEPVAGNMGVVLPEKGFLETLRKITAGYGALLIFDEVITGFRLAWGGFQNLVGIRPDLTCLGKIIGGGLPVGAYGGQREVMELAAPAGPVYQAGTLSGNPLAMSAGLAALQELKQGNPYERLENMGRMLAEGLAAAAGEAGVEVTVNRCGSLLTCFFTRGPVRDYRSATRADTGAYRVFFQAMLARGIYLPPSQFEAIFISAAHGEEDVEKTVAAAAQAFKEVKVWYNN